MYEDNGSQINIKNKMIINNINDRYYNIVSKYTPKNKNILYIFYIYFTPIFKYIKIYL